MINAAIAPRPAAKKAPKGFATSLGIIDDALSSFWFAIPGTHARLNENERRALVDHLKAHGLEIVPIKKKRSKGK